MAIEAALVERYQWSLREIDETEIESLLRFVFYVTRQQKEQGARRAPQLGAPGRRYCDQVKWL